MSLACFDTTGWSFQDDGFRHSVEAARTVRPVKGWARLRCWYPTTGLHPPVQHTLPACRLEEGFLRAVESCRAFRGGNDLDDQKTIEDIFDFFFVDREDILPLCEWSVRDYFWGQIIFVPVRRGQKFANSGQIGVLGPNLLGPHTLLFLLSQIWPHILRGPICHFYLCGTLGSRENRSQFSEGPICPDRFALLRGL